MEELVPIEENVVGEPSASSCNHARAEVGECEFERLSVITSDLGLLLCSLQLLASGSHLEGTEVYKPEGANSWDSKGYTVSPLCGYCRIWRISISMVEYEEKEDQNDLVEKLTPALH